MARHRPSWAPPAAAGHQLAQRGLVARSGQISGPRAAGGFFLGAAGLGRPHLQMPGHGWPRATMLAVAVLAGLVPPAVYSSVLGLVPPLTCERRTWWA